VRHTAVQPLAAPVGEAVIAPDQHRPELPADPTAVLLPCLEKDPGRRFPDANRLEQALARCGCAGQWTPEQAAAWWRAAAPAQPPEAQRPAECLS
jgi:serine/threonine-protein kinase